jgi:glycolate oxidase
MPLSASTVDALAAAVGRGGVLTEAEDLIPYSFDGTAALKQRPEAVIFPRTTAQVADCVRLAAAARIPIVTRGSGTGLSGGSIPTPGSLVLCLAQMNAILDLDPRNLTLRGTAGRDYAAHRRRRRRAMACSILLIPARCGSAPSAGTSPRIRGGSEA